MEQLIEDSRKIKGNHENLFEEQVDEDGPPLSFKSIGPDLEMKELADAILKTIDDTINEVISV